MSRAHPHTKNQRGWFPCAGSVTGSGSRVSEKRLPVAQHPAGSAPSAALARAPAGTLAAEGRREVGGR